MADVRQGLVSYWPLDVDNGGTTPDLAFGNDLTAVNGPAVVEGKFGSAFSFNGTSQYLTTSHEFTDYAVKGLPIYVAGAYTVSLWVKGAAQTAKYLFAEGSTTSANPLFLLQTGQQSANNAKADVFIRANGGTTLLNHPFSSAVVFDNTWHHIAWVDDRGVGRLYVDGVLSLATNYTYSPGSFSMNTTTIGALVRSSVGGYFAGAIDEVAIWERVLTPEEIDHVRTNGIAKPVPPSLPVITIAPTDIVRQNGDTYLFRATAIGTRPLSFQWNKNGSPIPDATASGVMTASYRISNLTTNESGDYYSVTVVNSASSTNSANATVTVEPDGTPNLASGLISYWPLDVLNSDVTLNTPDLYSGNSLVLTNMDAGSLIPGQTSNALTFDGVSQFIFRSNGAPVYNNLSHSVAFWVRGTGLTQNDRRIYGEGSSVNTLPIFSLGTDPAGSAASISVFIRNDVSGTPINGRLSTRAALDLNWHHVVWTDVNGRGKLYIDGVMDETDFSYTRGSVTMNRTAVGALLRAGPGNYFWGDVDEVATWNRALTWTEIQEVLTQGVPVPTGPVSPTILAQPVDRTNNVFTGDTVTFSVEAAGGTPLYLQWRRNGNDIPLAANPTATTNTLVLTSVQPADSGDTFSVVVTNANGSVTSRVAQLTVLPYTPLTKGEALKLDFGLRNSPNGFPGWSEMTLDMNGTNFAGVGVTVTPIGGSLGDRNRATPTNNPPVFSQAQLYQDFLYQSSVTDGTGMRILIERLAPNTPYGLTVWCWDRDNRDARIADWIETASGEPATIQTGFTWDGNLWPTNDYDSTFGALLVSSPTGKLQLEGRKNGGAGVSVFVNGLRLVAQPDLRITAAEQAGDKLRLAVECQYPGQTVTFEERDSLDSGTWGPPAAGGIVETHGPVVIAEFPVGEGAKFYRVKN